LKHSIPEEVTNSQINYVIDEYVRLERDRAILKSHWFCGKSFEKLAEEHKLSTNAIKNIIYGIGDKILLKIK
jgi:Mor family transcriptional regulator